MPIKSVDSSQGVGDNGSHLLETLSRDKCYWVRFCAQYFNEE